MQPTTGAALRTEISFPLSPRSTAVRITVFYIIGSTLWIVLSDSILHRLIRGAPPVLWTLEMAKGLVYVLVSGILLGVVIYNYQLRQERVRLVTESKLRRLRESGLIGIFSYDKTGTIKQANDAFLQIIGYSKQDLIDDRITLTRLITAEYLAQNSEADRQIAAQGFSSVYEEELMRKDGTRIPVIGGRAVMGGEDDYGIGYVLDISGLKKSESETGFLHLQLLQSEKLNALGQLAAGIAHDFNNLLNLIIGYSTLAQTTAGDPNLVRHNTELAISAATDATALVRQLLAFGRKQVLDSTAVELNMLVESHVKMLQRILGDDIQITFEPGRPIWVVADAVQLKQVLMNLIINARDAMERGGNVTISTASRMVDPGGQDVQAGEYAVLTVKDTGKGMDPGVLARIFEPFFTTKEHHVGTGLGLSTTYGIIRQSNGHICVDSTPGHGATFTILLPEVDQPAIVNQSHSAVVS
jgi:PAS domain S-box-containing protein